MSTGTKKHDDAGAAPALQPDERAAFLTGKLAIERVVETQERLQREFARANLEHAEALADEQMRVRTALRRLRLAPDLWAVRIDLNTETVELVAREVTE